MKNKIWLLLIILLLFLIPSLVYSETYTVSLSCPSVVNPGDTINCSINVSNYDFEINKLDINYNFNGSSNSVSFTDITNSSISLSIPGDAASNHVYALNTNSIIANDSISANNASTSFRVISNDTSLNSLSASNISLSYDSNTLTYSGITSENKTVISASATDSNAKVIEGTGEKNLNYGSNNYNVIVKAENGNTKTYKVNISRLDDRSNNNYLSSLFVSNTNIDFNKTKTEYNLTTNSSEVVISAAKEDNKSSVSGDTGKKSLNYGLNKFYVKVTSESLSTRTYTINITRNDTRSNNNYIKNITLSKGSIKFNKETTTYNINVDKTVEKIKVSASLDDNKSKFVSGFAPREVNLNLGNNVVYLKVQNERSEVRTYTLNINRDNGKDSDPTLKEITLSDGNINFKSDVYNYTVNVEYKVDKIKIYATPNNEKSKVTIDGDENLKVGKNKFKITVEAENGSKNVYTITVNRKSSGYKLSSNNYIKDLIIKGYDINFKKNIYEYNINTSKDKLDIKVVLDDNKSSYKIIGNENLKDYSKIKIKVTSEDGNVRNYTLSIMKTTNTIIIILIIVISLIAACLVYLVIVNMKKKNRIKKEKEEVIDEDFIN